MFAASLGAMMKSAGGNMMQMQQAASEANISADELSSLLEQRGFSRYPHQKSHAAFLHQESRRSSESYKARQNTRRRWENGLVVPEDARIAYERHAAERADIARRRAGYHQVYA